MDPAHGTAVPSPFRIGQYVRVKVALVALVLAVLVGGCNGDSESKESRPRYRCEGQICVRVPAGWTVKNDGDGIHIYRGVRDIDTRCDSEDDYTTVGVRVGLASPFSPGPYPARPSTYDRSTGNGLKYNPINDCELRTQGIAFTDRGRNIQVVVDFGLRADERRLEEVYAMLATVRVKPGPAGRTKGPIPRDAYLADGSLDLSLVPDFIAVADPPGVVVGYTPQRFIVSPDLAGGPKPEPVYGEDLTTLVGHTYPGRGFVPIGTNPEEVPAITSTTTSAPPTEEPVVAN